LTIEFSSGGNAMHLNEVVTPRDRGGKILWILKSTLTQLLSLTGLVIFWLFMAALLMAPAWAPALVNGILGR
jgi:hypothetical protein